MALSDYSLTYVHKDSNDMLRALLPLRLLLANTDLQFVFQWLPAVLLDLHN